MFQKLMVTTALTGALVGAAFAQSAPSSTSPGATDANKASTAAPSDANKASNAAPSGDAKFINSQGTDQWLSSNFIGVDVIGPDNEKIGDVSDILFEKNGNVVGYVVGVGGFLGIGAKNVALAPTSFQVMPGNTGSSGTTGSGSTTASADDVKLKLNMTKDQLKQAAAFESKRDQESKSRAASQPSGSGSSGGMNRSAPK